MKKSVIVLVALLFVPFFPSIVQAECGIADFQFVRCESGRQGGFGNWRNIRRGRAAFRCQDGWGRKLNPQSGPVTPCQSESDLRPLAEGLCENRCDPPVLDCSETPSLDSLITAICNEVHVCREDISVEYCLEHIGDVSASDELGLAESEGEITFAVIRRALADGTIRWDPDIYCDCIYRLRNDSSCAFSEFEPFGEQVVEEIIPEQCGNDAFPGVLLPDGFNPVTGEIEE